MKWALKTFIGAVMAGVGWKIGAESYEAIKKRVLKHLDEKKEETAESDQTEGKEDENHPHDVIPEGDEPAPAGASYF